MVVLTSTVCVIQHHSDSDSLLSMRWGQGQPVQASEQWWRWPCRHIFQTYLPDISYKTALTDMPFSLGASQYQRGRIYAEIPFPLSLTPPTIPPPPPRENGWFQTNMPLCCTPHHLRQPPRSWESKWEHVYISVYWFTGFCLHAVQWHIPRLCASKLISFAMSALFSSSVTSPLSSPVLVFSRSESLTWLCRSLIAWHITVVLVCSYHAVYCDLQVGQLK